MPTGPLIALLMVIGKGFALFCIVYYGARLAIRHERKLLRL